MNQLEVARQLAERQDYDRSYVITDRALRKDPNNFEWLMLMSYLMLETEKTTLAYSLGKRVTQLKPKEPGAWMNLGLAARDLRRDEESIRYNKRGLKYATNPKVRANLLINLSSSLVDMGRWREAEGYCREALELNPDSIKARCNLGFCQLAQRQWGDGWKNYRYVLGHEWRPRYQYDSEPEWDGEGRGNIVLYGEQGLGDQISFASMLPDAMQWAEENDSRIVLDVSNRLTTLLQRSFPGLKVYGTQGQHAVRWDKEDRKVDYSLPIGQIGEYFRNADSDFPGTPYLKADPDRVIQWRSLFETKKKPVIGLAWSSGTVKTGSKFRKVTLEQLLPILRSVDAHWVSLQYKPAAKEIESFREQHPEIDIVEYSHGTLSNDYDDTVAMIAALDHVVAMHTTANHVSGGLGVPTSVLVPMNSQWRYGTGDDFVWCKSVEIFRQTKRGRWDDPIQRVAEKLNALFPRVREAAGEAARNRRIRSNGAEVRPAC